MLRLLYRGLLYGGALYRGLLFREAVNTAAVTPGGTVRRPGTLSRVVRRPVQPRVIARPDNLSRVVRRISRMSAAFPLESRVQGPNEVVAYVFDFTGFPEIAAGETMSSPVTPAVSGLTIGTPAVITADTDDVEDGKGVQVTIAGVAGSYTVACRATMSGGAVREVRLALTIA